MTTIYHNPRCSKSRQTLEILQSKGLNPDIVLYLETPLDKLALTGLLQKLNLGVADLVRRSEKEFKDKDLGEPGVTDAQLLDAMVKYPKLIERPIVVVGYKAVLGRPPENVLELL
ncbi:MAG: arsenate reductase (glutaredoxin) [Porticoccaceae bacterium]